MEAPSNSITRAEVSALLAKTTIDYGDYDYSLYYAADRDGVTQELDAGCEMAEFDRSKKQYPILFEPSDPDVQLRQRITDRLVPLLRPVLTSFGGGRAIVDYQQGRLSLSVSK
jgi:hypothetical protein